jgi:hypothetical protein
MERDFFQRPFRMQFRYGESEDRASIDGTFEVPRPRRLDQLHTPPATAQQYSNARCEGISPVVKPSGGAARFGPNPEKHASEVAGLSYAIAVQPRQRVK